MLRIRHAAIVVGLALSVVACGSDNTTAPTTSSAASPPIATAPSSSGASSGSNTVTIVSFSFRPQTLTVAKGTTVTWTNSDTPTHTVTSDPGDPAAFDSSNLAPAAHFTFAFAQAGTYKYHCKIHPSMTATVTVTG